MDGLHGEELAGRHVPADQLLHLVVAEDVVDVGVREVTVDPRLELADVESRAEQQHGVPGRVVHCRLQTAEVQDSDKGS